MNDRYNGQARKRSIVDELRAMTLHDFVADNLTEGEALQKMARRIERLVPQCPPGKNTDGDKRDTLYYAVRMFDWAQLPITGLAGSNKSYKEFLDELATAEQKHRIKESMQGQPAAGAGAAAKRDWTTSLSSVPERATPTAPQRSGSPARHAMVGIQRPERSPVSSTGATGVVTTAVGKTTS